MNPLHTPRRLVRSVAAIALVVAAWLLLVPVTAIYVTSDDNPAPHDIATHYSWWTTEQNFVYSDTWTGRQEHLVNGVRLNCGNAFTTGTHEKTQLPAGPKACASVETPRCVVALCLFALGLLGLLAATKLPEPASRARSAYKQPRSQRRALRRAR